nr:Chain C, GP41 PEPTIDE ANALOG [Human immunodeficiency virus 1]
ENDKWAS